MDKALKSRTFKPLNQLRKQPSISLMHLASEQKNYADHKSRQEIHAGH